MIAPTEHPASPHLASSSLASAAPPPSRVDRWLAGAFIGFLCLGVLGLVLWASPLGDPPVAQARVPNVEGITLDDARAQLERGGFQVNRVLPSNESTDLTVRATEPTAGDLAPEGSEIVLALGDASIVTSTVTSSGDAIVDGCATETPNGRRHLDHEVDDHPTCVPEG